MKLENILILFYEDILKATKKKKKLNLKCKYVMNHLPEMERDRKILF